ncbi:VOC family protein [Alkalicoccobacillus murimartini]|uniref:Catechol 2,3-dioxygenase-like lactoylglutathione lyase family enzyme n=1 Tax=Alkalicoccobacillus murimartini TaxID=171685 RepID=A0ABT9YLK6_9BACI|nr:VOC family protein [Alkalicoccobacillus murimartini]MDQ0208758.1 catechol 2,3-dioxygenase-like lactoylglutathione lyase family enzyme [Alkalicoccobacillus murimartini]
MEGKLIFQFVPVQDLAKAVELYRDTLGFSEAWRVGDGTVAFLLPETEVKLMVEQVEHGSRDAAGPVFLVPSVNQVFNKYKDHLTFLGEPADTPDGLWLRALDQSGNGIYFTDESKAKAEPTSIHVS